MTTTITSSQSRTGWTGADKLHGFRFGCDGLCSAHKAMTLAGINSRSTLERRVKDAGIRKGSGPNGHTAVYCRRSITEYIARCAANEV